MAEKLKQSPLPAAPTSADEATAEEALKSAMLRAGVCNYVPPVTHMCELLGISAAPPIWMGLTARERSEAAEVLRRVLAKYPATTLEEIIWSLAAYSARPRVRGRKPKWLGGDGFDLVEAVEAELGARGWQRSERKAVRRVIGAIRETDARWQSYPEARLRDAYYDALPAFKIFLLDRDASVRKFSD